MQATAKELRFNVRELLNTVSRGEEIIITYRGKLRAKLIPFVEKHTDEDTLFGIWNDYESSEDVNTYVRTIRKGRFDVN